MSTSYNAGSAADLACERLCAHVFRMGILLQDMSVKTALFDKARPGRQLKEKADDQRREVKRYRELVATGQ
ncbi:hypothetical protein S7711_10969 [Stachybotrys chartarum IBT 7711]|uniref:Uncharacterized protein n=1 Tax=Stachybotrys chartarum (strain CBS 109288 / IBT 7711) TaxID=1280523 RepID=A0A084B4Q4_STACB|nr:hypothetical protein S7711_10969 [Stachybotrys chartarum IBT 7711]KFA52528.1 hypothetical protein S40293_10974 [Stachybotrys chartarum IBT 40293]KFA75999.1 hypothetical protein S40288_11046 [Stachybotrys chartarum IBT 40288]